MAESFDAVLAEMRKIAETDGCATDWRLRAFADRLQSAREAEVAERDARIERLFAANEQVMARAEAAERDTARLDWLADRNNPIGNVQLPTVCVMNNIESMRGAIDEAMRLDPELWAAITEQAGERENATKESAHED